MQIYSNIPLDLSTSAVVWYQPIPNEHKTIWVENKLARTALNLGSLNLPEAAVEFSGSLELYGDKVLPAIIISENNPLDTRKVGLFLCKKESAKVVLGEPIFNSGSFSLDTYRTGEFGQMLVVEDGAILAVNCSNETPTHPPEFWRFDSALGGWSEIQIWASGVQLLWL